MSRERSAEGREIDRSKAHRLIGTLARWINPETQALPTIEVAKSIGTRTASVAPRWVREARSIAATPVTESFCVGCDAELIALKRN